MSDDTPPTSDQPAGGTPPPPGGEVPPPAPPPPAYGGQAPPPPPYQAPPAGGGGYNAVDAIKYGWERFSKNPSQLLVPGVIYLICVFVVVGVAWFATYATILGTHDCTETIFGEEFTTQCGPGLFTTFFGQAVIGFVESVVVSALGAGMIKSALNVVDGKEVNVGDIFGYATKPNVLITAALVAAATFVGTLLCILPGIIVGFLAAFAMFFVVDKDMAPVDAIKASVTFMTSRLSDTIIFYLLAIVTVVVGFIACLIGVFVAAPVVAIGAAYTFRVLNNEPVSPVEA